MEDIIRVTLFLGIGVILIYNIGSQIICIQQYDNIPPDQLEPETNLMQVNQIITSPILPIEIPNLEEQEYILWLAQFINW